MNFIKSVTPDFVIDGIAWLKKVGKALGHIISLENPFKDYEAEAKQQQVEEVKADVKGLGGFKFDLSEDPMARDDDGDFKMSFDLVTERIGHLCEHDNSISENTKLLVAELNMPVAVAKKYAERVDWEIN